MLRDCWTSDGWMQADDDISGGLVEAVLKDRRVTPDGARCRLCTPKLTRHTNRQPHRPIIIKDGAAGLQI
jgi:hypothetical protein